MRRGPEAIEASVEPALPDTSLADEVLLEEGSGEDEGGAGLELDARQATEIRQIFLTTLPDYLEPIRQMVAQLRGGAGDDVRVTLTKNLSSMSDAARRVGVADAERILEALREDVLLFGDPPEDEEAIALRIGSALGRLSELTGEDGPVEPRDPAAESLVAALKDISGLPPGTLEKLLSAGLVRVDQILAAAAHEVAAVSGLDAGTVDRLMLALRGRAIVPGPAHEPDLAPPQPADAADPGAASGSHDLQSTADAELSLEETRGRMLRQRLRIRARRDELGALELRREKLREQLASTKQRIIERLADFARAEEHSERLRREESELRAELQRLSTRIGSLERQRLAGAAADEQLAREVDSLATRVDGVLRQMDPGSRDKSTANRLVFRPEK